MRYTPSLSASGMGNETRYASILVVIRLCLGFRKRVGGMQFQILVRLVTSYQRNLSWE